MLYYSRIEIFEGNDAIHYWYLLDKGKSEAINLLRNADLNEKSESLKNITKIIVHKR